MILLVDSGGPDQTARMRSLIWAFAVRICPDGVTHMKHVRPLNSVRKVNISVLKVVADLLHTST